MRMNWAPRLFRRSAVAIDETADSGDAISRKPDTFGVFLDRGFVRSEVDAINFVAGDVAMQPLNFRTHVFQNVARTFCETARNSRVGKIPGSWNFAFDDKFWHRGSPGVQRC